MKFLARLGVFLAAAASLYGAGDQFWGYHLILDCRECEVSRVTNRDILAQFIKDLVAGIDMKAYGEPLIEHFAEHNPDVSGYSLLQLIETSSITGHFVDKNGDAYLDIFSCKEFDVEQAKAIVQAYLGPRKIRITYLQRQA